MNIQEFLSDGRYPHVIAKVAIAFQSIITILITLTLILIASSNGAYKNSLITLIALDVLFIILHVTYRRLYNGPKVMLVRKEKIILLTHIAISIIALFYTSYLIRENLTGDYRYSINAIFIWLISLILGVIFFIRKYRKQPSYVELKKA